MSVSDLQLTRQPVAGRKALLCVPGTYCSPEVFELLDETAFPDIQILPISWMTSPGPWDLSSLGQRVAALARELELGPVLIAGHSSGGPIALVATLTEPTLFSGSLLADTGASTQGHGDIIALTKMIEAGVGPEFFQLLLRRSFYHQPNSALMQRLLDYASAAPREAALQALTSQAALDLSAELHSITIPTVIIHGRHDQARPIAHAELLAANIPQAELCLVESGHTPMVEVPSAYQEALQRLITLAGWS
jgi:pimeloyl-ACP methyl ester carboxylesterase